MFVRIKTTPNSLKKAVQIVESIRKGNNVSQKIVRHLGYAMDGEELSNLKMLAESIKIKLEADNQMFLFSPEALARLKFPALDKEKSSEYDVNLKELVEEARIVSGIHDIYGELFEQLGYKGIFQNPARKKAWVDIFKNIVLARIANPCSKMASIDMLEEDFGISIGLHKVYRMMDMLDDKTIERLNDITCQNTISLFGGRIDVIFFDTTTLYFESFITDELKNNGFSKDLKFNQAQVLFALMVNKEGLPIGYKVFPGNMYEGHTLIPMLLELRKRYNIDKIVCVADSGMFNRNNLDAMDKEGFEYIVGARLKNMGKDIKKKVLDKNCYEGNEEYCVGEFEEDGNKLIVSYKKSRAEKDALEREKAIERLKKKLVKVKSQKEYLSNYGYKKYLKVTGESSIEIDEEKIKEDSWWDGLHGVITNAKELSNKEILKQYVNLWHVEEAFRITKHDLKVRPIFHWTPERIRSHIAICFASYALVRHLEYRVKLQYRSLSVEKIRQTLIRIQTSILYHAKRKTRFALPSRISKDARKIYQVMGLTRSLTPWILKNGIIT